MTTADLSQITENKPIRDAAYETLKHAIIIGQLPAGSRLVETTFSRSLHISRTPLREALRRLESEGLVEYLPHRGVVVRAFDMADVEEIQNIRNALEMITLPAIIKNATDEDIAELREMLAQMDVYVERDDVESLSPLARAFHARLTEVSGLKRTIVAIKTQDEYIRRFSALSITQENRRYESHQEHHRMVDLVEARDLEGFTALMSEHIQRSKENCLQALADLKEKGYPVIRAEKEESDLDQ